MSDTTFGSQIRALEALWNVPDGFFFRLKQGEYNPSDVRDVLETLRSINLGDAPIPRRLVSLIWFMPLFMTWQIPRVLEAGGDAKSLEHSITEVENELEVLLGLP